MGRCPAGNRPRFKERIQGQVSALTRKTDDEGRDTLVAAFLFDAVPSMRKEEWKARRESAPGLGSA